MLLKIHAFLNKKCARHYIHFTHHIVILEWNRLYKLFPNSVLKREVRYLWERLRYSSVSNMLSSPHQLDKLYTLCLLKISQRSPLDLLLTGLVTFLFLFKRRLTVKPGILKPWLIITNYGHHSMSFIDDCDIRMSESICLQRKVRYLW